MLKLNMSSTICVCLKVLLLIGIINSSVKGTEMAPTVFRPSSNFCGLEINLPRQKRQGSSVTWSPKCWYFNIRWAAQQCDSANNCWCVNMFSGEPLTTHTHKYGSVDCRRTSSMCSKQSNEEYRICGSSCDNTCENQDIPCSHTCSYNQGRCQSSNGKCMGRCSCPKGLVRNALGICVTFNECPTPVQDTPICNSELNEQLLDCPPTPLDGTCADSAPAVQQLRSCTARCGCIQGQVRDDDGVCVDFAQCFNSQICLPNMEYLTCGSRCPASCDDPFPRCTKECHEGCFCKDGYIMANTTNQTCIAYSSCPAQLEQEEPESTEPSSTSQASTTNSTNSNTRSNNFNSTSQPEMSLTSTKCVKDRDNAIDNLLFDQFIPSCDKNGLFQSKQCYGFLHECWCVDKQSGEELQGSRAPEFDPEYHIDCDTYVVPPPSQTTTETASARGLRIPSLELPSDLTASQLEAFLLQNLLTPCERERRELNQSGVYDVHIPTCDDEGLYESKQCYGLLFECWCVNKTSGLELEGSRARQVDPNFPHDCDNFSAPSTSVVGSRETEENLQTSSISNGEESHQITTITPINQETFSSSNVTSSIMNIGTITNHGTTIISINENSKSQATEQNEETTESFTNSGNGL